MKYFKLLVFVAVGIIHSNSYAGGFSGDAVTTKVIPATGKESQGLIQFLSGVNPNDSPLFKQNSFKVGGAIAGGVTYNPANPQSRSNYPLIFNDRSNEFQLNRFRLFAQRDVNLEGKNWDIGGRFDFLIGSDARYTSAVGLDNNFTTKNRFNKVALPQFYTQIFAPIGNGITMQMGHFFTLLGSASPFNSVSYVALTEPSSHTGVLFNTSLNENLNVSAGAVLGTVNTLDNFSNNAGNWNFLGNATWTKEATSVAVSVVTGDDISDASINGIGRMKSNRTHVSFAFTQDFAQQWHYKFQHDYGTQAKGFNATAAHWYGIEQDLMYDVTDKITVGLRGDWLRDQEGLKIMADGISATYYSITAGLFWKPVKWAVIRPEIRYDISSNPNYNDFQNRQQFSFATNFAIRF